MDFQERYDELDNIVSSLNLLINEIKDKNYIDLLNEIKYEVQDELEEISEKLSKQYEEEEKQLNYQFENGRL